MVRTNREILTGGKKYSKNKSKKHAVEEVVFDKDSRNEYLTGFHKRKLERQKKAQEFHKEQDRLAKIEERKKLKLEKQEELLEQMKKYKDNLKELSGGYEDSDEENGVDLSENIEVEEEDSEEEEVSEDNNNEEEEWEGFQDEDDKPKGILKKREVYISNNDTHDETEVIIEDISNGTLDDIARANYVNLAKSKEILEESIERAKKYAKIAGGSTTPKKKKFRYLSKTERRQNQKKAITNKRRRS